MPIGLEIWTVYDNPSDYPGLFVVRKSCATGPTNDVLVFADLESAREAMRARGLACLSRFPDDNRVIVEVWL